MPELTSSLEALVANHVLAELAAGLGLTREQFEERLEALLLTDVSQRNTAGEPNMSVNEIAALIGCDHQVVRRAINCGALRAYKFGNRLRVSRIDYETWKATARVTTRQLGVKGISVTRTSRSGTDGHGLRALLANEQKEV